MAACDRVRGSDETEQSRTCRERLLGCERQLDERACDVRVRRLQLVDETACKAMHAGEGEKRKCYRAVCRVGRPLSTRDGALLNGLSELVVHQNTPVRVLHRRAPLVRDRVCHLLSVTCVCVPSGSAAQN